MDNVTSPSGLFSLKWKGYGGHLTKGICNLLEDEDLTDVTLACEGSYIRAHKLLLSLCSPYFKKLFQVHSPEKSNTIVILNHVRFTDLQNVLHFIYTGQVNVSQADLNSFLQTGELLQIEGLASCSDSADENGESSTSLTSKDAASTASNRNANTANSSGNADRLKRAGHSSSQNSSGRFSEKRFKAATTNGNDRVPSTQQRKTASVSLRSTSLDKQDQPLIQIRPATELVEDIDPLDDSNISSYSDHKSNPGDIESIETEVNIDALKAEGVEVIDVDEKDEHQMLEHGNGEAVLADYLDEGGDISQQEEFYGTVTASGADDSIFDDNSQTRRVSGNGGHGGEDIKVVAGLSLEKLDQQKPSTSVNTDRLKVEAVLPEEDEVVALDPPNNETTSPPQQRQLFPQVNAGVCHLAQTSSSVSHATGGSGLAACGYCHATVPECELRNHILSHQVGIPGVSAEQREDCPYCGRSFKNKNSLKVHKSIYHRSKAVRQHLGNSQTHQQGQFPPRYNHYMGHGRHYYGGHQSN